MSPFLAVSVLTMLVKRRIPCKEEVYYEAVDALIQLLEESNDEKYQLIPKEED